MSYPTCKTCKHWSRERQNKKYPDSGTCDLADSEDGLPENGDSLAFAEDPDDYFAFLTTAPDFGCIQHELLVQVTV